MKTRTLLTILLAILFAACVPTPLPLPTNLPTVTPQPTKPFFLETTYPLATSTPQATNSPNPTQSNLLDTYCDGSGYFFHSEWAICDIGSHRFLVFGMNGSVWSYSYEELGLAVAGKDPEYDTRVVYSDGGYAYLTVRPHGFIPTEHFLGTGIALFHLHLDDGYISTTLWRADHFYSISFSPTGRRRVVVEFRKPLKLRIVNRNTGASSEIELEQQYDQAGEFVWSSDGLKLAYKLIINEDECSQKFAIRLLSFSDRASMTRQDFLVKSSVTVIDDMQINTCQSSDPMYYIDAVNDDFVILKEGTTTHNIPVQPLQATAVAAARMTQLTPSATWTPFPPLLNSVDAPQIAEVLIRSQEISRILWCDPDSDVNLLNEVYADTSDFEMTPDRKLMVSTYIGDWAVEQAGYLTFTKAYYMWDRSTDPYPRVDPDMATQAARFAQIGRGTRMCPDILDGYIFRLENIHLQEDMAVVRYEYGALYEDTLRRIDRRWYVVKSLTLSRP